MGLQGFAPALVITLTGVKAELRTVELILSAYIKIGKRLFQCVKARSTAYYQIILRDNSAGVKTAKISEMAVKLR